MLNSHGGALGAPMEFVARGEIHATYKGELKEMLGGGWLRIPADDVTDDTRMSLALGAARLSKLTPRQMGYALKKYKIQLKHLKIFFKTKEILLDAPLFIYFHKS